MKGDAATLLVQRRGQQVYFQAPEFTVEITAGPDQGTVGTSVGGRLTVGTAEGVDLRLTDPTVSRFHGEFEATERGVALRDLGSTNGTWLGSAAVCEVLLRASVDVRFGQSRARFVLGGQHEEIPTSGQTSFGEMVGSCPAIRQVYKLLERVAPTTAPVLITGESGTGKELAARALHASSDRSQGPFEVVDCGGLPPTLIESELFGHEKGAFERADGGTVFLDELGELPLELQPKLLRVLGEGELRRLGSSQTRPVDVRIVAATNRDLRREVNTGNFRSDLFFRLAVIQVPLPSLRERLEDLPLLVRVLLERIATERGVDAHFEPDANMIAALNRHHWPGNIRELRNYLEQLVILRIEPELPDQPVGPASQETGGETDLAELEQLPWRLAKNRLVQRFERRYITRLLEQTNGNVAAAARRAGVDRGTLFRTIRRLEIKVER